MNFMGRKSLVVNNSPAMLASVFGPFSLSIGDNSEILISNRRASALLAILCTMPGEPLEREHLSKLLWPGRFEAQARASLRQCLLALGKMFEPLDADVLDVNRTRICLHPGVIQTDLDLLEEALAADDVAQACSLLMQIGGQALLGQFQFGPSFDEWISIRREQVEARLQGGVHGALDRLAQKGRTVEQAQLLEAWMLRDPAAGQKALFRQHDCKIRIAVLPFHQIDDVGGDFFLADGVVDELITSLGKVPGLLVTGRTSSSHFRDTELQLPEIAQVLHVTHVVEGCVHRHDDAVRINTRLIDGATGFEIWTHRYDGSVEDIFRSREQVAHQLTTGLCGAVDIETQPPPVRMMTANREAYRLYLQGRALTVRAIGDNVLAKAIELLERALELDPLFAECWTALAEAHVYTAVYTPCLERMKESERMARCANRAIELAPMQGHARSMLAIHQWTQNDIVGALDLAFEAYRLEPDNPDVGIRLGSFLLYIGRTAQALPYITAAIQQDPVNARNYSMLSVAHLNLGDVDAAIAAGQRMVDLGYPSMWLAAATAASGDRDLAVEQYKQTRLLMNTVIFPPAGAAPMPPEVMEAYWDMAARGLHSGCDQARSNYCQVLKMLHATLPDKYDSTIVLPAIWMGDAQMVFRTLGEQITPANFFGLMSVWTDVEPTRQVRLHPDFMGFAKKIGMVAAWDKYGWPDLMTAEADADADAGADQLQAATARPQIAMRLVTD